MGKVFQGLGVKKSVIAILPSAYCCSPLNISDMRYWFSCMYHQRKYSCVTIAADFNISSTFIRLCGLIEKKHNKFILLMATRIYCVTDSYVGYKVSIVLIL